MTTKATDEQVREMADEFAWKARWMKRERRFMDADEVQAVAELLIELLALRIAWRRLDISMEYQDEVLADAMEEVQP